MFIIREQAWLLLALLALLRETSFPLDSVNQHHVSAWHPRRQWGHQKGTAGHSVCECLGHLRTYRGQADISRIKYVYPGLCL